VGQVTCAMPERGLAPLPVVRDTFLAVKWSEWARTDMAATDTPRTHPPTRARTNAHARALDTYTCETRFQKIMMARTKAAAARTVKTAKAREAARSGDFGLLGAAKMITHDGICIKKGAFAPGYKERYLALRNGWLTWYRIEDLVVDEFEAYDVEQSEELGSWHLAGNKIEKVESTAGSEYHRQWGDGKGFVLSTAGGSRRFMFKQAESRDKWVEKLRLVIAALDDAAREEDPDVPSIEIAITLNMAMPTVGRGHKHHLKGGRTPSQDVDDFQEDLKTDLVMATSGCRDKINITNVQEGLQSSFRIYYEDRALLYII